MEVHKICTSVTAFTLIVVGVVFFLRVDVIPIGKPKDNLKLFGTKVNC